MPIFNTALKVCSSMYDTCQKFQVLNLNPNDLIPLGDTSLMYITPSTLKLRSVEASFGEI